MIFNTIDLNNCVIEWYVISDDCIFALAEVEVEVGAEKYYFSVTIINRLTKPDK